MTIYLKSALGESLATLIIFSPFYSLLELAGTRRRRSTRPRQAEDFTLPEAHSTNPNPLRTPGSGMRRDMSYPTTPCLPEIQKAREKGTVLERVDLFRRLLDASLSLLSPEASVLELLPFVMASLPKTRTTVGSRKCLKRFKLAHGSGIARSLLTHLSRKSFMRSNKVPSSLRIKGQGSGVTGQLNGHVVWCFQRDTKVGAASPSENAVHLQDDNLSFILRFTRLLANHFSSLSRRRNGLDRKPNPSLVLERRGYDPTHKSHGQNHPFS